MTAPEAESLRVRPTPPRRSAWRAQLPVVGVVALGGALGATARYALSLAWPTSIGSFPWATFLINVAGCAVMGVLMVLITEVRTVDRLVRPFFGTGVLGGFTTFSTYAVDVQQLADDGHPAQALVYLAATPLAALTAVWLASATARRVLSGRRRRPGSPAAPLGASEADESGETVTGGKKSL
ncbi:fluoride efflux transporter CrcB [Streptomyces sp. NPDC005209]|uniref:fluoride efflux transporter CrcB n=1 Tax=Streptomyces sp. NPDC005209 TaxID=3156715 RepID=UPI0033A70638